MLLSPSVLFPTAGNHISLAYREAVVEDQGQAGRGQQLAHISRSVFSSSDNPTCSQFPFHPGLNDCLLHTLSLFFQLSHHLNKISISLNSHFKKTQLDARLLSR